MSDKRKTKKQVPRKRLIKEQEQNSSEDSTLIREVLSVILFVNGIFLFLATYSYLNTSNVDKSIPSKNIMGKIGHTASSYFVDYLGYFSLTIPAFIFIFSYLLWRQGVDSHLKITFSRLAITFLFGLVLILASASLGSITLGYNGGGYIGSLIAVELEESLNKAGTILLCLSTIIISLGIILNLRIYHYINLIKMTFSGARVAARDTGNVLSVSAKVGGKCLKKIPEILPKSKYNFEDDEEIDISEEINPKKTIDKSSSRRKRKKPKVKRVSRRWVLGQSDSDENNESDFIYSEETVIPEEEILSEDELEENSSPRILRGKNVNSKKTSTKLKVEKINNRKRSHGTYDNYQIPSKELLVGLDSGPIDGPDDDELLGNCRKLEQSLRNFKLGGKVVEVHPGPVVTLYQFEPAAGIKVQRIINLADDLALALKVESVRVYAPVPGKGTVGIEVPNAEREIVRLRDVIESEHYQSRPYSLSLALGKDTYGDPFVADLAKMPHLLIAGATGTGKSVCINSLLMSLLFKNSPDDLRLILIDPKMLELSIYEKIPHLLSPVITNPKRARGVLYWAVEEMERRYSMMKEMGVRDLSVFNRMVTEKETFNSKRNKKKDALITLEEKDVVSTTAAELLARDSADVSENQAQNKEVVSDYEPMPRIVIVVDELADLMLTVGREIEELLTRLAQKARAAGIHLVLATQRPSVNVITGLIKANFPARISFKVASKIDARTVMDQSGAERLLGQGDMLFLSPVVGRVKRLHSPFVSDQEVHDVVSWIQRQGEPDYDPDIERVLKTIEESEGKTTGFDSDNEEYDPLYDQAVNLVIEKGQASTSMVQRVFRIGYNRAARILETMEKEGVVGPADGAKPRQVISAPMQ